MFTYLWIGIYENLVVKSVSLNLFSLLGSSSSSSVDASSFGCVDILSLYLTPHFVISSLIIGTFKSACKTVMCIPQSVYYCSEDFYFDISVIFQCLNYWLYPRGLQRMSRKGFSISLYGVTLSWILLSYMTLYSYFTYNLKSGNCWHILSDSSQVLSFRWSLLSAVFHECSEKLRKPDALSTPYR